jgi:hypothetical protein
MSANHVLVWNARGLNSRARRSAVRDIVEKHRISIVCLQETKVWLHGRASLPQPLRRSFDSLVLLVSWCLWKERNSRTFDRRSSTPTQLFTTILEEAGAWVGESVYPSVQLRHSTTSW